MHHPHGDQPRIGHEGRVEKSGPHRDWGQKIRSLLPTYRALSEAILQLGTLELGPVPPSEVEGLAFHHICHDSSLQRRRIASLLTW